MAGYTTVLEQSTDGVLCVQTAKCELQMINKLED